MKPVWRLAFRGHLEIESVSLRNDFACSRHVIGSTSQRVRRRPISGRRFATLAHVAHRFRIRFLHHVAIDNPDGIDN